MEKLLRTYGSLERVRQAPEEELVKTVGKAATARLRTHFANDLTKSPLVHIAAAPANDDLHSLEEPVGEHVG